MNYNESYLGIILNALSCLGNALIKGGKHVSISGRIGFNSFKNRLKFYKVAEKVVDTTFYPIEGWGHCKRAYESSKEQNHKVDKGFTFGLYVMIIILWTFCVPLSILFWSYYMSKYIFNQLKTK